MIKGVDISLSDFLVKSDLFQGAGGDGKSEIPFLKKNQVVDAKVLKVISPARAELLIAGKRVIADTSVLLTQGEDIKLKVSGQGNLKILKLTSPLTKLPLSLSSLLGSLSKQTSFSPLTQLFSPLTQLVDKMQALTNSQRPQTLFTGTADGDIARNGKMSARGDLKSGDILHIKDILHSMALKSGSTDKGFLPQLLDRSGLLQEKKLSALLHKESFLPGKAQLEKFTDYDLKAYVSKLISLSQSKEMDTVQPLKDFVENIEKFQVLNNLSSDSNRYLIPFPIFADNSFSFGQILFDLGEKEKGNETKTNRLIKLSFLLNMTNIGALRMDCSVFNKDISGVIQVSTEEISLFVKTMLPELEKRLQNQGFNLVNMDCDVISHDDLSETVLFDAVLRDHGKNTEQVVSIVV
ncbi:MAG: hypothetical protein U9N77_04255 [Thermodesulfobacteriota bacterium]|nr:hypothetical protein [Thermodesulfobacteriota bacterium]